MTDIIMVLKMILSDEEMARISVKNGQEENLPRVYADTHGMSCKKARKFIRNLICLCRDAFILVVIHGFNHGTAIKELIREEFNAPRVKDMHSPEYNPGLTVMQIVRA